MKKSINYVLDRLMYWRILSGAERSPRTWKRINNLTWAYRWLLEDMIRAQGGHICDKLDTYAMQEEKKRHYRH